MKRRFIGGASVVGHVIIIGLAILFFALTRERFEAWLGDFPNAVLFIAVLLGLSFGVGMFRRAFLDRHIFGVKAARFNDKTREVTLRFKDPLAADRVAKRTMEKRRNVLAGAREFLERP